MSKQQRQISRRVVAFEDDGCGEAAQQRRYRRVVHLLEHERLLGPVQYQYALQRAGTGGGVLSQMQRNHVPGPIEQRELHRDRQRLLLWLVGGGRRVLRQGELVRAVCCIVVAARGQSWRAGLRVPGQVRHQVDLIGIAQRAQEIFQRGGVAIVSREIQIHAVAEAFTAQSSGHHAHQLRALLVDGGGVEVVDLTVLRRAHRMRQRAGVFRELRATQQPNVFDALERRRVHVSGELLLAENREAFLQRKLKPVAAGDTVAAPVVEILMRHHRLDRAVFVVGGGVGIGQKILRIEDVEALVLHRAHVEIVGSNDVEHVEVVLAAVGVLVPAHRALQRIHGVAATSDGIGLGPDHQLYGTAAVGNVVVLELLQAAGDQREQIAGLGMRIDKARPVATMLQFAVAVRVATSQQHREPLAVGIEGDGVAGQHIGAIGKEGDVAETLRLALGQQEAAFALAGQVQAFQRGVGRRLHSHTCFEHAAVAHAVHFQYVI